MNKWIKVSGIEEVPVGMWLFKVTEESHGLTIHTGVKHPNITVIGGLFHFDQGRVIAYRPIPEYMEQ